MPYCVRADIELRFGPENVRKWSDLDNTQDETAIANRIAAAIEEADEYIDSKLRGGRYVVPLVGLDTEVPTLIKILSATLAGVTLYDARGVQDFDPATGSPLHRMSYFRTHVDRVLQDILAGRMRLSAATVSTRAVVPEVVTDLESSPEVEFK